MLEVGDGKQQKRHHWESCPSEVEMSKLTYSVSMFV